MILEHAHLPVDSARIEEFVASAELALPIIMSAPGCHGATLHQQHEDPSIFMLLVEWDSVEAHMAFRELEIFQQWRALTHPFYVSTATVTHFLQRL